MQKKQKNISHLLELNILINVKNSNVSLILQ